MKKYLVSIVFLMLATTASMAQQEAKGHVLLTPELYNALWSYIMTTECKNPVQILNALNQARVNSEPKPAPTETK